MLVSRKNHVLKSVLGLVLIPVWITLVWPGIGLTWAREMPPLENLQKAQVLISQMQARVNHWIEVTGRGDYPGEPGENCHELTDRDSCRRAGCSWIRGICREGGHPEILENDKAVNLALIGMGKALTELGEKVDACVAVYGTEAFWWPQKEACQLTRKLWRANQGAKLSASLPPVGLATPDVFDPNDREIKETRNLLYCP